MSLEHEQIVSYLGKETPGLKPLHLGRGFYTNITRTKTEVWRKRLEKKIKAAKYLDTAVFNVLKAAIDIGSEMEETFDLTWEDYETWYCSPQRNRSTGDIWRHMLVYFPDVTIEEVMAAYVRLATEKKKISVFLCGGVMKMIAWTPNIKDLCQFNSRGYQDEYGLNRSYWLECANKFPNRRLQ